MTDVDDEAEAVAPAIAAGVACVELLREPAAWINRRVETIEMLTHEATRGSAENGDPRRAAIWEDQTCRALLLTPWQHYVLFAVVSPNAPNRRILKYAYGEDFSFEQAGERLRDRFAPRELWRRATSPGRLRFAIECPGAWRARSFHVEIATPEELRFELAVLFDFDVGEAVRGYDFDAHRASLYVSEELSCDCDVQAYVEITPERAGRTSQAAAASVVVAALLWLGVSSGLDAKNPGAAVSTLLGGAALFSGFAAGQGKHKLVRLLFSASNRWLALVTLAALTSSATLAMEYPDDKPVAQWRWAAIAATIAAARLLWAAVRAPK